MLATSHALVAQWIEQRFPKPLVACSTQAGGAMQLLGPKPSATSDRSGAPLGYSEPRYDLRPLRLIFRLLHESGGAGLVDLLQLGNQRAARGLRLRG